MYSLATIFGWSLVKFDLKETLPVTDEPNYPIASPYPAHYRRQMRTKLM